MQLTKRNENEIIKEINNKAKNKEFEINGEKIETVEEFKYLGRILNDKNVGSYKLQYQQSKEKMGCSEKNSVERRSIEVNDGILLQSGSPINFALWI